MGNGGIGIEIGLCVKQGVCAGSGTVATGDRKL